jgi:hypothetical protein
VKSTMRRCVAFLCTSIAFVLSARRICQRDSNRSELKIRNAESELCSLCMKSVKDAKLELIAVASIVFS